jgi:hypothetical protein
VRFAKTLASTGSFREKGDIVSKDRMKRTPIFDTNIFGDVQRGLISQADWSTLLRHRSNRGWPLSSVTALELLAGLDAAKAEGFLDVKQRIARAYNLCNGRILEDPRVLLCKRILLIPFPDDQLAPAAQLISRYMDVVRYANSLNEALSARIHYKGATAGRAGFDTTSVLAEVMASPKKQWIAAVERMADETYPAWRKEHQQTGKRVSPEKRRELKQRSFWQLQRTSFITALLDWLHAPVDPATVTQISQRLDAVFEFTIFVAREFLLTPYSLEGHQSDVFDQFQLQYLGLDKFVIVTGDPDLSVRTRQSPQAARIMSFDQFLRSL